MRQYVEGQVREECEKKVPAKRVNIVSLKVVKEANLLYKERRILSPKDSYELIRPFLEDADREMFVAMALNVKNQPTSIQVCHIGSLNASLVHPREVLKMTILGNAASIIVFHIHPSGSPEPSKEDLEVTNGLKAAGEIVGVELLDHLIIGDDSFLWFREKGFL